MSTHQSQFSKWLFWGAISLSVPTLLLLLVGATRLFSFEARFIPSKAMLPTLTVGDRIIIHKSAYLTDKPERGDIVLFNLTPEIQRQNPQVKDVFIKRVIGLPGEKIEVRQGSVYVNNQPLREPYIATKPDYKWGVETVPADSYFVLGDNRNESYDSRFWGYVPRSYIIGKATQIYYPFDRYRPLK
jgi:signal peptidase I